MTVRMDPQRFDELVSDALDLIPPELADAMDNVVVLVANRHPQHENLLGQYEGVALTERGSDYAGSLPDAITIYREALLDACDSEDEVVDQVAITVIHEVALTSASTTSAWTNWAGVTNQRPGAATRICRHPML